MTDDNRGNIDCSEKMTGTVKYWKGTYGFVIPDDPKMSDVFIYHENIEPWRKGFKELKEGQKVKFHYVKGKDDRLEAKNLEIEREEVDQDKFKMK